MPANVLLLGATGYLGGSVLASLKKSHPDVTFVTPVRSSTNVYPEPVIAIAKEGDADLKSSSVPRSSTHLDKVREAGGEPVIGSLDDFDLLSRLSAQADVVINAADSDNIGLINAILEGQKRRKADGRGTGSIIQTSGCAIFLDHSKAGKIDVNGRTWTDSEGDIRSLTTSMVHGQVDVPLMKASENGDVNSFIICPSAIYGTGSGPVRRDSLIFRMLIPYIVQRKRAEYVGEGTNRNEFVHVDDVVSLFEKVFQLALDALTKPPTTTPYERYFIASTIPVTWKALAERFGRELHKRGVIDSPDASSVSYDEAGPFAFLLASDQTTRPLRASQLGWKPRHLTLSDEAFSEQVETALRGLALSQT